MSRSNWSWILIGTVGLGLSGCANNTETGALVGAGGGAAVGGIIGSMSHSRAGEGALIGAAAGALGGALIGHSMDEADKKKSKEAAYADDNTPTHVDRYAGGTITQSDVVNWTSCGTRDDVIIDRIERSHTVFHLAYADEQDLRDAGVSEVVIQEMKATARR
jgi:outer membrane lipoprotein SlyB